MINRTKDLTGNSWIPFSEGNKHARWYIEASTDLCLYRDSVFMDPDDPIDVYFRTVEMNDEGFRYSIIDQFPKNWWLM